MTIHTVSQRASQAQKRFAIDDQTGDVYELKDETRTDYLFAILSIVYLLLTMALFFWLLFDTWIGQNSLANLLRYPHTERLAAADFRLPAYAFIGGALGGIVNGIRSFLVWHAERFAFGQRFVWKYITAPWLGAALALFTVALIRSGVALFNGDAAPDTASLTQELATFSVGVLAGYGSHKVFVWLDAQVTRLFQVQPVTVLVPELTGKSAEEAEEILRAARLKLGEVQEEDQDDPAQVGRVIRQTPPPGSAVATGVSVALIIGRSPA